MELDIFSQIDDDAVQPLMRIILAQHRQQSKPSGVRRKGGKGSGSVELEDITEPVSQAEKEATKVADLHAETRGKPAPLPATESDFPEGSVRRSLKSMPKAAKKKKRK